MCFHLSKLQRSFKHLICHKSVLIKGPLLQKVSPIWRILEINIFVRSRVSDGYERHLKLAYKIWHHLLTQVLLIVLNRDGHQPRTSTCRSYHVPYTKCLSLVTKEIGFFLKMLILILLFKNMMSEFFARQLVQSYHSFSLIFCFAIECADTLALIKHENGVHL